MFIHREGNKNKYAREIINLFPKHNTYIEPFFGVGGIYFNKPLATYNIVNDHSKFIYDLWLTFKDKNKLQKIIDDIDIMMVYKDIMQYENNLPSKLLFSVNSIYGQESSLRFISSNSKEILLERLTLFKDKYYNMLKFAIIGNDNYIKFLKGISLSRGNSSQSTFIYCDPPYSISKGRLKDNKVWTIKNLEELILQLNSMNVMYAISEYNDTKVLELLESYNLKIHKIKKSLFNANKGNTKYEILATNYDVDSKQLSLFDN